MVTYIKLDVRCVGCGELIATPSEADIELWRLGINVHQKDTCLAEAERKLGGNNASNQ